MPQQMHQHLRQLKHVLHNGLNVVDKVGLDQRVVLQGFIVYKVPFGIQVVNQIKN
jgi:hypothetical protein